MVRTKNGLDFNGLVFQELAQELNFENITSSPHYRAVHSGGAKGAVAPARKTKCFFSNIVSDFAGLFLVAILVRNLTKTEFAPADKKS